VPVPRFRPVEWIRRLHEPPGASVRGKAISDDVLVPLLKRASEGDEPALTALLTRLHVVVSRFIRRRMNYDLAAEPFVEDAAMEALIKIAEHYHTCRADSDGQVVAWALSVARTVSIDLLRQGLLHYGAAAVCIDAGLPSDDGNSDVSRATALLLQVQQEVQDSLPEALQRLLWLHLVEGASWADVGAELGTSAAGAKRRYQRGQARLRRLMFSRIHDLPAEERNLLLEYLARIGFDRP
jgi:RNA polymerase sigma factor (sigma-70 family)